jgi:transporter family protein
MTDWLLPALGFALATGLVGVTAKLALRSADWPELVVWTTLAYVAGAVILLSLGVGRLQWTPDTPWALVTAVLPVLSLIMFFIAIGAADVSRVVPVTSAYPLITAVVAVLALSEALTLSRVLAMLLIVTGVIMLTR